MPPEERAVARAALNALSQDDVKDALKSALREWLREQLAEVGKWTLKGMGSLALAALVYFLLMKSGWKFEP